MKRVCATLVLLVTTMYAVAGQASQDRWIEGRDYSSLVPVQHTTVPPGKIEVMEVFSYGCIFCDKYQPIIKLLERDLPANAKMTFLPASFGVSEDWPMFQRAYFAAQALGIADKTHQAIFDAVRKTGELSIVDAKTNRPTSPQPSPEEAARCYERLTGVKSGDFLRAAHSFGVDTKIRAADAQVIAMQIPGTPCIVVNGKYRVKMDSVKTA
jgi:thiol:disulfide interchange protein DsbA